MKLKNIQKKLKKKSNKVNYKIIEEVQSFWRKLINYDNFSENSKMFIFIFRIFYG